MIRSALPLVLFGLALLAGCARNEPSAAIDPVGARGAGAPPAELAAACREAAERAVLFRDRGQTMRNDSAEARTGTPGEFYPSVRAQNDRLGGIVERDRLARDCVRNNPGAVVPR